MMLKIPMTDKTGLPFVKGFPFVEGLILVKAKFLGDL